MGSNIEVVDMSTDENPGYPPKSYKINKKTSMVFDMVTIPKCKKTNRGPWTYEGVTFRREEEDDDKKKKKKGGKTDWTFSIHAKYAKNIQEASTRAMIAAGLTPYTG